ncbi:MAG TPA: hypothetical protein PLO61_00745 [Fimbriimonadaceae bacterium]|nr:hypothetical protein [Fimbriimonadaceae bacterium]HRJ32426.1 hypothetical protein [Fimbriimonadaceae bacterium]
MPLNTYVAELRRSIHAELVAGAEPSVGSFSSEALAEARVKGRPQMGSASFRPHQIQLEFIYHDPLSAATVFVVTVDAPERIVFLPVPGWVVESIWQGEIDGSYHFESDAVRLVDEYRQGLDAEGNAAWFEKRMAKRRE